MTGKGGGITGSIRVVLNTDNYLTHTEDKTTGHVGCAGVITLDAQVQADTTITGTYRAQWGEAQNFGGEVVPAQQP